MRKQEKLLKQKCKLKDKKVERERLIDKITQTWIPNIFIILLITSFLSGAVGILSALFANVYWRCFFCFILATIFVYDFECKR